MIVSFVIVYEKIFEPLSSRLGIFNHFPDLFDKILISLTRLNHAIFTVYIPRLIIRLRYFLVIIYFILGVIGLFIVFYHPKLSPPRSRRYQFFQLSHPFERFEYEMRDQFLSYINEDKDNVTNPSLIFVFGVEETDLINPFHPDRPRFVNNESVIYNKKFDFYDPAVLRWFDTFLRDLNRSDLFTGVQETYAQWLTIGHLLQGFLNQNPSASPGNEFFVPSTREDTLIAMNRLFKFFSESNQLASSGGDSNRGSNHFRLGFLPDAKTHQLRSFIFIVNMNVTFDTFAVQHRYYEKLHEYFEQRLEQLKLSEGGNQHVYEQVKHG